ncbi:MAG: FG-GAP-like repeat-containing protein, partial [Thermoanaerobaculia bacterium]
MNDATHGWIVHLRAALCVAALAATSPALAHTIVDLAPYHLEPEDHFTIELDGITLDPADAVVVRFTALGGGAPVDQSAESFTATDVGVRVPAGAALGQHDVEVLVDGTPNTGTDGRIWVRNLPFELIRQSSGQLPGQVDAGGADFKDSDFGDVDGDGFLDAFESISLDTGAGNDDRLYINQLGKAVRDCAGTSFFCNQTATQFEQSPPGLDANDRTYDADLTDLDLDGDVDLVRIDRKSTTTIRYLVNDGSGDFDDRTLDFMPDLSDLDEVVGNTAEVDVGDADGDGRPDLLLCSWGGSQNGLLINELDTSGRFELVNDRPCDPDAADAHALCEVTGPSNRGCAFGQFDNTGGIDILLPSYDSQGFVVLLHAGQDGNRPLYTVRTDFVESAVGGAAAAGQHGDLKVADLDGDGDDDAVVSEPLAGASAEILWNDDGNRLVELASDRYAGTDYNYDVSLGDLDRDGDIDLMLGSRGDALGPVLINKGGRDGQMRFDPPTSQDFWLTQSPGGVVPAPTSVAFGLSVAPGDFDLDGDLDLLTGGFYRMGLWVSNLFQQPGQARDWVFILDKTRSMVDATRDFFEPAKNVLATFSVQRRDDDAVGFVTFEYEGPDPNNPNAPDDANKAQRVVEVGDESFFTLADTIRTTPLGTCGGNCTPIGWGIKTGMEMADDAPVPDPDLPREQILVLATDGEQNQAPHPDEIIPD